jgi:hypothetical protein
MVFLAVCFISLVFLSFPPLLALCLLINLFIYSPIHLFVSLFLHCSSFPLILLPWLSLYLLICFPEFLIFLSSCWLPFLFPWFSSLFISFPSSPNFIFIYRVIQKARLHVQEQQVLEVGSDSKVPLHTHALGGARDVCNTHFQHLLFLQVHRDF